jgi:hypothetical protein
MNLLTATKVQVKRYGVQAIDDNGNIVVTPTQTFNIQCNWQPVPNTSKGELAKILPDGVTIDDVIVLFTRSNLKLDREVSGTTGDEVIIEGELYKVLQERDWSRYLSIKHREYLLVRKTKR